MKPKYSNLDKTIMFINNNIIDSLHTLAYYYKGYNTRNYNPKCKSSEVLYKGFVCLNGVASGQFSQLRCLTRIILVNIMYSYILGMITEEEYKEQTKVLVTYTYWYYHYQSYRKLISNL